MGSAGVQALQVVQQEGAANRTTNMCGRLAPHAEFIRFNLRLGVVIEPSLVVSTWSLVGGAIASAVSGVENLLWQRPGRNVNATKTLELEAESGGRGESGL